MFFPDGHVDASRQPHQVKGVGRGPGLVQIVHAPDEPSFFIAPRPEVLDVEIAHTQHGRRFHQVSTNLRPELQPAVKGRAEEGKCGLRHVMVFEREVLANDGQLPRQPVLEIGRGLDDVHHAALKTQPGLNPRVSGVQIAAPEARFIDRESSGELSYLVAHALLDLCVADV